LPTCLTKLRTRYTPFDRLRAGNAERRRKTGITVDTQKRRKNTYSQFVDTVLFVVNFTFVKR